MIWCEQSPLAVPPAAEEPERFGVAVVIGGFPNPFSTSTSVRFQVLEAGPIELTVSDVQGRRVRTQAERDFGVGIHEVVWDGTSDARHPAASGVYFVRLEVGDSITYQKVLLTK